MKSTITFLVYMFCFFSGFARLNQTKIFGTQIFILLALLIIVISIVSLTNDDDINYLDNSHYYYKKFLLWSLLPLAIGLFYGHSDALYFYIYTLIPLLLHPVFESIDFNYKYCITLSQISLIIVIVLGWLIYYGIIPYIALFQDVSEAEFGIGYWGISYLKSSRNHDYMYPMVCAAMAIWQYKNAFNALFKNIQLVVFLLCQITLLASLSRGAMIIAAMYFYFFYKGQTDSEKKYFIAVLLMIFVFMFDKIMIIIQETFQDIFLSIFGLREETASGSRFSNEDRKDIYWSAIKNIVINPFGYGIQNYSITNDYGGGSAENAYLTIFVERGWFAGFYFIKFFYTKIKNILDYDISYYNMNYYLVPAIAIYFLFNYEFTSYMCGFVFLLVLINDNSSNEYA